MKSSRAFRNITAADAVARSAYQVGKTPLLPVFAAALGASDVYLGLIVSVSTLTGMILKPFVGILSDRWGRRIWLLLGTAFFAGIPFLYPFVNTPAQLLALRLVHGLATAIYGPVTLAYVAQQTRKQQRAEKLGIFSMARGIGYIVGPLLAGLLLLRLEPAQIFTGIGLVSALVFIPILRLPEPHQVNHVAQRPGLRQQISAALSAGGRNRAVWISGGLNATLFVALYAIKAFLPINALATGMSIVLVGGFLSLQEATHVLLKPWGGRLGDRYGHRKAIFSGMLLLGLSFPLLTLAHSAIPLLAVALLMGAAQATVFPSTDALVSTTMDPEHLGAGMGIIGTLKNLGKVLGPIIGGTLIAWFDYALMLQLMGVMLLIVASAAGFNAKYAGTDSGLDSPQLSPTRPSGD
jgi:MFS family permease